ncbi:MAG: TerB family tellurite resistance protein [Lautropia sp.]
MNTTEAQAIVTIGLLAAHADGAKHARERDEIARIASALSQADGVNLPTLAEAVQANRVTLAATLPALTSEHSRRLAYEWAVGVCNADGAQSPSEQRFLAELRTGLGLDEAAVAGFSGGVEVLAAAPLASDATSARPATPTAPQAPDDAALEADILNAAIVNGALELLPESLSTMAIIPLQMKLVYRIGLAHGYPLDSGHVKDFLATAGVGLTSQYLEQAGRKLLGGLLGRIGGGLAGGVGRQAVSSGMSFASTYALGQVAKRYYAGGRTLSAAMLKDAYGSLVKDAQSRYGQYLPMIQDQARTLDAGKVLAMVRGR